MAEVGDRKCAKCFRNEHTKCMNPGECHCICNDIDWERPSSLRSQKFSIDEEVLEVLLHSIGRWAKIQHFDKPNTASNIATRIRKDNSIIGPGKWDAAGRKDGNGGSWLHLVCLEK